MPARVTKNVYQKGLSKRWRSFLKRSLPHTPSLRSKNERAAEKADETSKVTTPHND